MFKKGSKKLFPNVRLLYIGERLHLYFVVFPPSLLILFLLKLKNKMQIIFKETALSSKVGLILSSLSENVFST